MPEYRDNPVKTGNYTVVFAEPIFRMPPSMLLANPNTLNEFVVPEGSEHWAGYVYDNLREYGEEVLLGREYVDIVIALQRNEVPVRGILAHRDLLRPSVIGMFESLGVEPLKLPAEILSLCFPRDMMSVIGDDLYINLAANFRFKDGRGRFSRLGEGGLVLNELPGKVFVGDHRGTGLGSETYKKDIKRLQTNVKVGIMPHTIGSFINMTTGERKPFIGTHPDRESAVLIGRDDREYLLVDQNYYDQNRSPWGSYKKRIERAVEETGVNLVVIPRDAYDVPNSLNFSQFHDRSVVMTSGHLALQEIVSQIVGDDKVITTIEPIVFYPTMRRGSIRCMFLLAPKDIVN